MKRPQIEVKLRPTIDLRAPKDAEAIERKQLEAQIKAHRFFASPPKLNRFNDDRITNRKIYKIDLFRRLYSPLRRLTNVR